MSRSESVERRPRILLAKPGMDGHNRGIRVVSRALRDAGCEVIYLGIRRKPVEIAAAAEDEDADIVGLSLLSGAHVELTRQVADALSEIGLSLPLLTGGIIPEHDHAAMRALGVEAIFGPGTSLKEISTTVWSILDRRGTVAS